MFRFIVCLLCLLFLYPAKAQIIPNADFEQWETDTNGILQLTGWESSNRLNDDSIVIQSVWQDTTAFSGNFNVKMRRLPDSVCNVIEGTCPGFLSTRFDIDPNLYIDRFSFDYKHVIDSGAVSGGGEILLNIFFEDSTKFQTYSWRIAIDEEREWTNHQFLIDTFGIKKARILIRGGSTLGTLGFVGDGILWLDNLQLLTDSLRTSINPLTSSDWRVELYPNPTSGILYLSSSVPISDLLQLQIYSARGVLMDSQYTMLNKQANVVVENLSSGIYFLKLTDEKGRRWVKKFVKE